ncbi:MAG: MMPL family transporter, partial [Halobacteriovoraceae bacterium]|nr:MMPL family transporter [Halobacteriovoraceae bacterium]
MTSPFKEKLCKWPLNNPVLSLSLAMAFLALWIPFLFQLKMDFSSRVWFRKTDENIVLLNKFERKFGSDESVIIIAKVKGKGAIFTSSRLKELDLITEEFWKVSDIIRVDSLSNFHWTYAIGDEIVTEPFIPEEKLENTDYIIKQFEVAKKHRIIPGTYMSEDGTVAILFGRIIHRVGQTTDYHKVYRSTEKMLEPFSKKGNFDFYILGQPAVSHHFQTMSFQDLRILNPILILLVILYLIYCFRSWKGVFLPLTIIGFSIISTTGLCGLLGFRVNSLTFILPGILIAVGIADSVHLLSTYYRSLAEGIDQRESCYQAMQKNIWPIFLTSVSTAIGFFSLVVSDVLPVSDLGVLAGTGTLFALIYSYLVIVPVLSMTKKRGAQLNLNQKFVPRESVTRYVNFLAENKGRILILFLILTSSSLWLALSNEINSNPYKYFKKNSYIRNANDFVLSKMNGIGGPELIVDSLEVDGIKDPVFLKKVALFQDWLEDQEYINKVVSIINILREVNQSLFLGASDEYRISEKRDVIAQELFLYTMALPQGMELTNRIDGQNRNLRITLLWRVQDSKESLEKILEIETKAKELGLAVQVTGKPILFQRMNGYVVFTFFSSMGMALLLITFLMMLVFSSFRTGLLSLIPNLVPIIFGAGILTIIGQTIDVGCAIVASVTLGIAVDDTIHFLSHYNQLMNKGYRRYEALIEVLTSTGLALVVTTLILVSCFGIFMFASLTPNINFGVLCAFVLAIALICDLVILPAII